jgi:hypothetical protein
MNAVKQKEQNRVAELALILLHLVFNFKISNSGYNVEFLHGSPRNSTLSFNISNIRIDRQIFHNDNYLFDLSEFSKYQTFEVTHENFLISISAEINKTIKITSIEFVGDIKVLESEVILAKLMHA